MGFLFASKKKLVPEVTGLQIQTAVNVVPIPIGYGTPRVPMNIIYANGFTTVPQKQHGGKGFLAGGKGDVIGFKYYATWIGALGEGQVGEIAAIYQNQKVYTFHNLPDANSLALFLGEGGQLPWGIIQNQWPEDAFAYKQTAYVGFDGYELDATGTIPQFNFLVTFKFAATFPLYRYTDTDLSTWLYDADPALCIMDFLTIERYGVRFNQDFIDTTTLFTSNDGFDPDVGDAALSTYCQAVGLGWSLILNNSEPASSILDRWLKNLVVAPVWTGSQLRFIPYCDSKTGANPGYDEEKAIVARKYYTPNISPLFALTDDDFLQADEGEDPLTLERIDAVDVKNTVRVNFRDRHNQYNDNVAEAKDELAVEMFGPRVDRLGPADEFTLMAYAGNAAQMQLQRNMSVRTTATFRLGPQWCILEPMDVITISDVVLGLNQFPVRIRQIEEDEKGVLTLMVEEYRAGSMQATFFDRQENRPPDIIGPGTILAPSINDPIIFEPTHEMLLSRGEASPVVMIGACGGPNGRFDPNWGGCDILLSLDNISYQQFGTISAPANMGVTGDALPSFAGANPDLVDSLTVSLVESNGILLSVSSAAAAAGASLCVITHDDGTYELLGFTDATLVGPHQYTLTGLYRGMYGTKACAHDPGSKFGRIDGLMTEIPLQLAFIGSLIYAKFPSFNIFGLGKQDISQATVYTYTPAGFGIGIEGSQLALALQAPGPYNIDLGSFVVASGLDLGSIAGECAPVSFEVDLENT